MSTGTYYARATRVLTRSDRLALPDLPSDLLFDLFDRDIKNPQIARKASREDRSPDQQGWWVDKGGYSTPVRCRVRGDVSDV